MLTNEQQQANADHIEADIIERRNLRRTTLHTFTLLLADLHDLGLINSRQWGSLSHEANREDA